MRLFIVMDMAGLRREQPRGSKSGSGSGSVARLTADRRMGAKTKHEPLQVKLRTPT